MGRGNQHQDESVWILTSSEDNGARVQHCAEESVPCRSADVVVERATWRLDRDQRAKAVCVVSCCYLNHDGVSIKEIGVKISYPRDHRLDRSFAPKRQFSSLSL